MNSVLRDWNCLVILVAFLSHKELCAHQPMNVFGRPNVTETPWAIDNGC